MNSPTKREIFLLFQNHRIEVHHRDGSILQVKNQNIMYISAKGIKNTLSMQQIHRSPDLSLKISTAFRQLNIYSNQHIYWSLEANEARNKNRSHEFDLQTQLIKKGIKIKQFQWESPEVEETREGYKISSDCRTASLTLLKNLYIIQVKYLQWIGSSNSQVTKTPNMTKLLLQKYNHEYTQFPVLMDQDSKPEYFYRQQERVFSIFNIPNEWKYPLHLIWNSLITYKIIPHQFCYIEFTNHEMPVRTVMPPIRIVGVSQGKNVHIGSNEDLASLPILGKVNHNDLCLFMKIEDSIAWFVKCRSFLFDGFGFWSYLNNSVNYRISNKREYDREFHPKALPYSLRFENQPERSVLVEVKLFVNYLSENEKLRELKLLSTKSQSQDSKFDNENNLIRQQMTPQIGQFRAYSNGTVIVKFIDRCLLTLNSKKMQAKVIKKNGESCFVDLGNTEGINFQENKQYISHAIDFQERVFFPEEWALKQERNEDIEELIKNTQTVQKTSKTYLKL